MDKKDKSCYGLVIAVYDGLSQSCGTLASLSDGVLTSWVPLAFHLLSNEKTSVNTFLPIPDYTNVYAPYSSYLLIAAIPFQVGSSAATHTAVLTATSLSLSQCDFPPGSWYTFQLNGFKPISLFRSQ